MDKPVCKLCGKKHWSREPCSRLGEQPRDEQPVAGVRGRPDKLSKAPAGERPAAPSKQRETLDAVQETYEERVKRLNRERQARWRRK